MVRTLGNIRLFQKTKIYFLMLCLLDSVITLSSISSISISISVSPFRLLTETKNKCNARDQASNVVLRKLLCVKYLRRHVINNHSRDFQASNCARVSIKSGRATRSKRQLLELSKNQW